LVTESIRGNTVRSLVDSDREVFVKNKTTNNTPKQNKTSGKKNPIGPVTNKKKATVLGVTMTVKDSQLGPTNSFVVVQITLLPF